MHTIIGMLPHIMVIGMPQFIMRFMLSQHILSMSMFIMPIGCIMQVMPFASILHVIFGIIGMPQQDIIGIPPHIIMQGVPLDIIDIIMSQQSFIISMVQPSAGFMAHIMPSAVIEQLMWHIIGIMVAIGMDGMPIIGMLFIGIMFIAAFISKDSRVLKMGVPKQHMAYAKIGYKHDEKSFVLQVTDWNEKNSLSRTERRFIERMSYAHAVRLFPWDGAALAQCKCLSCRLRAVMSSAQILDFDQYHRRKVLRDCGMSSTRRKFLWVDPQTGHTWLGEFKPAQLTPAEALRQHAGRAD
jgi:hypothetical protein